MDLQTKTYRLFDIYPDLAREYAKKLHKKKEDIEFTQKFYAADKAEKIGAERAVVSYITTDVLDRDSEVLLPKGMRSERYEKSGKPVFWGHRYDEPRDVVGQCQWLKPDTSGHGIMAKTAFRNNEFADEIYQLYTEDLTGQGPILRGFSVGFIPLEWNEGKKADDPRRTYTAWELLEFSCVSIPCNPEAQTILGQKHIKLCDRLQKDLGFEPMAEEVQEPIAQIAHEEPEVQEKDNKILDDKDNPSMSDIFMAIAKALNPPQPEAMAPGEPPQPWYAVQDVFPVDFPSGHCVFVEYLPGREVNLTYRQKYKYDDGKATLVGERGEVVVAYRKKEMEVITKPETTETTEAPDVAALFALLNGRMDTLAQAIEALNSQPKPEAANDDIVIDPPADVLTIDPSPTPAPKQVLHDLNPDEIEAAITAAVKRLDMAKQINEGIALALDRLRGRVR